MRMMTDCAETAPLGYSESDPRKNGEYLCLHHFLNLRQDEMVVYDVGANNGEWSMTALMYGPPCTVVHAFEPAAGPYSELARNLTRKEWEGRVNHHCRALSDHHEARTLYVTKPRLDGQVNASHASSFFLANVQQHPDVDYSEQLYTECMTLDYYAGFRTPHIHYLKIDTEGMELAVLKGSNEMLRQRAIDVIQFEYGAKYEAAGATLKAVYDLLKFYDFAIHRICGEGLIHIPDWHEELECRTFCNYLAVRR